MRLNFLLGVCAVVMLAVAGVSCSKKGNDGGDGGVAIQPNGWMLISWNEDTTLSGRVYLELGTDRFTLYQQIGNLSAKRCLPVNRRFAYVSVQIDLVGLHRIVLVFHKTDLPRKDGKHQTVLLFLMTVVRAELPVDHQVFSFVILCHVDQAF